jgi:hypothetical protein
VVSGGRGNPPSQKDAAARSGRVGTACATDRSSLR